MLETGSAYLKEAAQRVLEAARARDIQIAAAESCTGGQIASLLTEVPEFGRFFDRGFVAYTEDAKIDLLGVPAIAIARHGAVSPEVARLMAVGALSASKAQIALAVTGYAGSAGPHDEAGLVYLATLDCHGAAIIRECHYGDADRERVKDLATHAGLEVLESAIRGMGDPEK